MHCCLRTRGCAERAGRPHGALPGDGSRALFPSARGESQAPAVPKLGKHSGRGCCKFNSRSNYRSSCYPFLPFLLLRRRHRRRAANAPTSCLRPVPSSSPRELSQRFAPPRPDWPAERAASQWSRLEAVSLAALGLPAEPAAAGSKEVRARGRRRRARSGAGRTPRGAPDPGAGGTQVGRGGTPLVTEEEPSRPSWWGRRTG